jgi:septal ring factor EnvC (AmiA/AmiB activator)
MRDGQPVRVISEEAKWRMMSRRHNVPVEVLKEEDAKGNKFCTFHREFHPKSEFGWDSSDRGRLRSQCRSRQRDRDNARYTEQQQQRIDAARQAHQRYLQKWNTDIKNDQVGVPLPDLDKLVGQEKPTAYSRRMQSRIF